jgi:polysaccharide export outer membrane protein
VDSIGVFIRFEASVFKAFNYVIQPLPGAEMSTRDIRLKGEGYMRWGLVSSIFCAVILCFGPCLGYGQDQVTLSSITEFYLGPEDLLEVSVWKDEALTKQVVVRPDGKISFPLVGDVDVKGRTVDEVRQTLEASIKEYVPDTPVTVMVVGVRSPKVYVVGKVAKPGLYIMAEPIRVMQGLAMAGGTTPFADKDDILIIRKDGSGQKFFKFNYTDVAKGKDLKQNMLLQPGDTVVVP